MSSIPADWWRQAAVYQVYPRSFADANGDGIGDFAGLLSRVPYLAELGIDAVWLSPFYPSALADGGYDVDDYRDVDPRIGTLADFDAVVTALHAAGIRVLVDIVPNHTSDRHPWFVEALASPKGSAARGRFIFRDGRGTDGEEPPNDWTSLFGGSAWEPVGDGQWYFHVFAKEQPDLDWGDASVRDDFDTTLRFWADRGVDGFRVDVAHGLAKDISEPYPARADLERIGTGPTHPYWDRDEVQDIYRRWRAVFDEYDPPLVGVAEASVEDLERRARYAHPETLGQAFSFDILYSGYDPDSYRDIVDRNLAQAERTASSTTWTFQNHDSPRHTTRFGLPQANEPTTDAARAWLHRGAPASELDLALGLRRARAVTLMMLALPGSAYLYQGEELGLPEVGEIPASDRQDPSFFRNGDVEVGRDGCRVPLPWTADGPSFGFGPGGSHLPQPSWFADFAADRQDGRDDSTLTMYRTALRARRELQTDEVLAWVPDAAGILHFRRPGGWHSVTNFSAAPVALPAGEVVVTSGPLAGGLLPADTTAWIVEPAETATGS